MIGFSPVFGARPLARVIRSEVENKVAEMILANEVSNGGKITVDLINSQLDFAVV